MGRVSFGIVTGAALLASYLLPRAARADEVGGTLTYQRERAIECPDEEDFRTRVASRLGRDPFSRPGDFRVKVKIAPAGKGYKAQVSVTSAASKSNSTRELDDAHCDGLVETAASTVALAMDPVAASSPHAQPALPPPPPPPVSSKSVPTAVEPSLPPPAPVHLGGSNEPSSLYYVPSAARPPHPIKFGFTADLTGTFGLAPAFLLGARVGAFFRGGSGSLALELGIEGMPSSTRPNGRDLLEGSAISGRVVPCAHFDPFFFCGTLGVHVVKVDAPKNYPPSLDQDVVVALGVRPGLRFPIGKVVAFRASLDIGVPVRKVSYRIMNEEVWSTASVLVGLGAGFEAVIP